MLNKYNYRRCGVYNIIGDIDLINQELIKDRFSIVDEAGVVIKHNEHIELIFRGVFHGIHVNSIHTPHGIIYKPMALVEHESTRAFLYVDPLSIMFISPPY